MATTPNDLGNKVNDPNKDIKINKKAKPNANHDGIAPEAIGRNFLKGWSRSEGVSTTSFIKYAPADSKQKRIKATVERPNNFRSKSFPVNVIAAKIRRFFCHCLTRRAFASWNINLTIRLTLTLRLPGHSQPQISRLNPTQGLPAQV